jgi:hypothetical protein
MSSFLNSDGSDDSDILDMIETDTDDDEVDWEQELGKEMFDRVAAWLTNACANHVALHRNRASHGMTNSAMLARSWRELSQKARDAFPELPEQFTDPVECDEYEEGLADMFERCVFQGWMAVGRDDLREWVRDLSTNDALALARTHHTVATADINMTSFVCELLERSPMAPQRLLSVVSRVAAERPPGGSSYATMGFNFAAADDLLQYTLGKSNPK